MEYYFADGDQQKGPFDRAALRDRGMKADSLVWREGMASWERADALAELRDLFAGDGGAVGATGVGMAGGAPVAGPAPGAFAASPSSQPYSAAPAYTPAPAAYGLPSYGSAPAYGPPSGYGGAPQPSPALAYGGYGPAAGPPSNGLAIASMILGILALPMMFAYCVGLPCAILAIVFGHVARGKARRGEAAGAGMALAGLICGYLSLLLAALLIVCFFFIIGMSAAHAR